MANEAVTASDAAATGTATPPEGGAPAAAQAEGNGQESNAKLQEIEAKLREMTERLQSTEAERQQALDAAKREEAIRKGLQRETTAKLQEYARLKQQLDAENITATKLDRLERLTSVLLEQQLDPETRQRVLADIDAERAKKENEVLRAQLQRQQQQSQSRPLTPEYRTQLKDHYFPEYDVDPQDPRIDWAADGTVSDPNVWYQRVRTSIEKIAQGSKAEAKPNGNEDLAALIARQVEEATRKLREEYDSKLSEATAQQDRLKAEAEEAKRIAEEAAKRKKGADREGTPVAAAAQTPRRFSELPKDWAYDPEKRKEVSEMLNNKKLRDELVAAARRDSKRG